MIEEIARTFAGDWKNVVSRPETARDRCVDVSTRFRDLLAAAGVEAEIISGFEMVGDLVLNGHTAVLVGERVYDWTARQFDASAPVPLIQPVSEWRTTWQRL